MFFFPLYPTTEKNLFRWIPQWKKASSVVSHNEKNLFRCIPQWRKISSSVGYNGRKPAALWDTMLKIFLGYSTVPDTASYIRGWMQMVLAPNDLFSWNNKYSKYTVTLLYLHSWICSLSFNYAHQHSLCACRHLRAVKGSSSSFPTCSLISLWVTSSLPLCL